jgi:diadenosine tetraphosphate (Ap4A) HIT family hydrolase
MQNQWRLDAKLQNDSIFIADLQISQLRLIDNVNFPWVILVPCVAGVSEIIDLPEEMGQELWQEIQGVTKVMQKVFIPDKINIASIGNVVKQLHIHIVMRYNNDLLFPQPVWGQAFQAYDPEDARKTIDSIIEAIKMFQPKLFGAHN